jgi:hypothetical protein
MELKKKVKRDMKAFFNAFIDANQTTTVQTPFDMHMEDAVIEGMFYPGRNPGAPPYASYARIRSLRDLNTLEITYAFVIPLMGDLSVAIEDILKNEGVDAVILPVDISQMHQDPPRARLLDYGWTFNENYDVYHITKEDLRRKKAERLKTRDTLHIGMNRKGFPLDIIKQFGTFLTRKEDDRTGGRKRKSRKRLRK